MTAADVVELAAKFAVAAEDADLDALGIRVAHVEMFEMGDGSGRAAARFHTMDENDEEASLLITLAASEDAPYWALRTPTIEWEEK